MNPRKKETMRRAERSLSFFRTPHVTRCIAPPIWENEPYAVTDDGRLLVRVVAIQGLDWIRQYQRWSVRLECEGVYEALSVSLFINLGSDPSGPRAEGRQSKFYRHWSMAKGGPPKKGQSMGWDIFLDKFF